MTVTYESHQDFATKMARIQTITLQSPDLGRRYEDYRCYYNDNDSRFRRYLHQAMGYKRSTVNDWQA